MDAQFDELIAAAEAQPFAGWDFSWLAGRMTIEPAPWDYTARAADLAARSPDLLDMGTGGGEWLAQISNRPPRTFATEAWPPNVPVAGRNLAPVGIPVVQDEGAVDNADQATHDPRGRMPFRDGAFQVVVNRHEAFVATEVARVLAPGGDFLTQQVDNGAFDDYYPLLGLDPPPNDGSWLPLAIAQVEAAGLRIVHSGAGVEVRRFADVGALAWYLQAISWAVHQFAIADFRDQLRALHDRVPVTARETRLWVHARK